MTSRLLLNLALLIIVLILVAVVVLEPGKIPEPKVVLLSNLDNSAVNKIKIVRQDKDTIELEKKSDQWYMLTPYALAANNYKIESVMKLLQTESTAQYDTNTLDLARYDLLKPTLSIDFNDSLKIDFGNLEPLRKQRYVRIGQQLHLIADYYYYQLVGSSTDYLDHALIGEDKKIRRIELPGLTLSLEQEKWTLSPEAENYSADAYTDLLNEWQHAHAVELRPLTESQKTAGQLVRIFLQGEDTPIEYTLHKTDDDFILARANKAIEYVMARDKADALLGLQQRKPDVEQGTTEK